ncbi:MAG: Gfo/Idh/MocA family oxidoreductase [Patescibacteria group bacterium]
MKSVFLIGAGNIGSRHLQGLKAVREPLIITVIDPSPDALTVAQERYTQATGEIPHEVVYASEIPANAGKIDCAIIATSASVRREAMETLCARATVRALILEKILFQKPGDFRSVKQLLKEQNIPAWVNCPMRVMPAYRDSKKILGTGPFVYHVSGANWGLMCNAIHFMDHLSFLTGNTAFTVDTRLLKQDLFESKRKGFSELDGTLTASFDDGSILVLTHTTEGTAPIIVEMQSSSARIIVRETERKQWIAQENKQWQWAEQDAVIPYQSGLTGPLVEEIISKGTCALPSFEESANLHLQLYEPIRKFLKMDYYPFT